ncbi:beta-aspartyl-peptidase [Aliiglaciecola sp. CAU 1673]|uniref:beta-aspartyl-peptidase n=1 Tax=Aliiglaciecola sp. CAU 1673 TaxID=3032595 RepID=UPI0023DB549A|nr:beta-aspartyl-peptidase [Aliiglaciecola sp. CAU 1673]MDF2178851.1 beta-aspartyl-peptidase [Aliiglaciecola sp. CAU 1673]
MSFIKLIKGAEIFSPTPMGRLDVLLCDGKVAAMEQESQMPSVHCQIIDGHGLKLLPGLVDSLVHISGGGGEGGFHTRTPQMNLEDAIIGGVTTLVAALGTDAVTRTLPDMLAKARALESEGLSTYCYTGSYQVPVRTLTNSVMDDIVLIDKFIGVGEVAISDHRSSQPTLQELLRLASDARVGGMLSGKAGIVSVHVGEGDRYLALLHQAVEQSELPPRQFYPTHINRNQSLLEAGVQWCRRGGVIDFTSSTNAQFVAEGEIPAAQALAFALQQGIDVSQLTMSSDGNASLPVFDKQGRLTGLEVGRVSSLWEAVREAVQQYQVPLESALASVTLSVADLLKLSSKGRIEVGADADLLLVDDSLQIHSVLAKGQLLMSQGGLLKRGTFS